MHQLSCFPAVLSQRSQFMPACYHARQFAFLTCLPKNCPPLCIFSFWNDRQTWTIAASRSRPALSPLFTDWEADVEEITDKMELNLLLVQVHSPEWPLGTSLPSRCCQGKRSWFLRQHLRAARPLGYGKSWHVLALQFICVFFRKRRSLCWSVWEPPPSNWLYFFTRISLSIELFSRRYVRILLV